MSLNPNKEVDLSELSEQNQPAMTQGEMIDRLYAIREERKDLNARDKELIAEWREVEGNLIGTLEEQGGDIGRTEIATATITENVLPNVEDWDEVHRYVIEEQALHLLHRRISTGAYKELLDAKQSVPGIVPYVQKQISLRKRTTS